MAPLYPNVLTLTSPPSALGIALVPYAHAVTISVMVAATTPARRRKDAMSTCGSWRDLWYV